MVNNADQPAFPTVATEWPSSNYHNTFSTGGLTKRELLAAIAMNGVLFANMGSADRVARDSVRYADALLDELKNTSPSGGEKDA